MDGILNLHKPVGMTSHDVVKRVRRILTMKRIGHAGTLDPGASGVLLVCVGRGTKLVEQLMNLSKVYRGTMRLGVKTDTQDAWGQVIWESPGFQVTPEQLQATFLEFTGPIQQIPPMFSALKHQGRRLYDLARQGIQVERQPREVQVRALRLLEISGPLVNFEVECSRGTYVRTLCSDMGDRLGCGAHLSRLERTRVGPFTLEASLTLEALEGLKATPQQLMEQIHPICHPIVPGSP
ncbi:MAG: tRNA pseudouridine(55) synthase TruB [Candidatus Tectomicrobia bacterium]|uniref:tRNA pseudouridine synthase B n=1 Tax=Tectimicrobiota bacterium TaxID=2528274 RepID=A0A932CQD8_UNCTE|nr:tRNA pseudouridine(55) synthase TruB [Candidatus Tectomicrobia bacterium]